MRDKPSRPREAPTQIVATAGASKPKLESKSKPPLKPKPGARIVIASRGDAANGVRIAAPKPKAPPKQPRHAGRPLDTAAIAEIFRRFRAAEPEPKGELTSLNAFTFLVAVVLSAQATDVGVNKATPALFALADTPEKMLALGEERVRDLIKTIGLFRAKAKNVIALSRRLVEHFGGQVPDNRADLETLPGVGRKTANVVLNNAYGVAVIAVDTHLFRVSNRIPLALGKTPLDVELGLEKAVPAEYKRHAHHWLILHGRYVCKARKPLCGACPIADLCRWPDKTPA